MQALKKLGGVGAVSFPGFAFAAPPDVSAVVTEISGSAAPIAAVGAAGLLVLVGIKVFKWVRRAM